MKKPKNRIKISPYPSKTKQDPPPLSIDLKMPNVPAKIDEIVEANKPYKSN